MFVMKETASINVSTPLNILCCQGLLVFFGIGLYDFVIAVATLGFNPLHTHTQQICVHLAACLGSSTRGR